MKLTQMKINQLKVTLFLSLSSLLFSCGSDESVDPSLPRLTVSDVSANEGTDLRFILSLDTISMEFITVTYSTQDGSATSGEDYVGITSETISFLPGQQQKTITIETLSDSEDEGDETVELVLSSPENVNLANEVAIGTIDNVINFESFIRYRVGNSNFNAYIGGILGSSFSAGNSWIYGTVTSPQQLTFNIYFPDFNTLSTTSYDIVTETSPRNQNGVSVDWNHDANFTTPAYTSKPESGQLTITTLDRTNNIIAGTFNFTVESQTDDSEIIVEEGEFQLRIE